MRLLLLLICLSITFTFGFITGLKKTFPYNIAVQIKQIIFQTDHISDRSNKSNLQECLIPELAILPDRFDIVVGHAYATEHQINSGGVIAENVERFISNNKNSIKKIFFTGDVFAIPSSRKWQKLVQTFHDHELHIAPGNHDTLRDDSYEIFQANRAIIRQDYPYFLENNNVKIIVEDSVSSGWGIDPKLVHLLSKLNSEIFITRHNVVVKELFKFANSDAGLKQLLTANELDQLIDTQNRVTWIMGDGGAFRHSDRISCHTYGKHRFIVNGIGQVEGDKILILHEDEIYSHLL